MQFKPDTKYEINKKITGFACGMHLPNGTFQDFKTHKLKFFCKK